MKTQRRPLQSLLIKPAGADCNMACTYCFYLEKSALYPESEIHRMSEKILEEIVRNHEAILKDPEPVVKVHELGDSSVNFVVRPWVKTDNYWDVYWDITRAVKERFDAEGVSIPFPQRDVHVHQITTS